MSVINDMLRDLDKRQAPEVGGNQLQAKESIVAPASSNLPKLVIFLLMVVLLAFLGYFFLWQEKKSGFVEPAPNQVTMESVEQIKTKPTLESMFQEANKPEEVNETLSAEKTDSEAAATKPAVLSVLPDQGVVIETNSVQAVLGLETKTEKPAKTQTKRAAVPEKKIANSADVIEKPVAIETQPKVSQKAKLETKQIEVERPPVVVKLSPAARDQQNAEQAKALISKGEAGEAYRQLYTFIGQETVDTQSRIVLARYLLQEGRLAEAGDVLLNAPVENSPEIRQLKARLYAEQGEHQMAIYILSSDLPDVALHSDYYVLLAAYYQRYGSAQNAQETYAKLVEYDETVADWWAGLGLASDRNNQREQAMFAYQQALDLKGLSPDLLSFVQPRLMKLQASNSK